MAFSGLAPGRLEFRGGCRGWPEARRSHRDSAGRGPDLSPAARPFVVEGCAGVFRELAAETAMTSAGDALDKWPHRWAASRIVAVFR